MELDDLFATAKCAGFDGIELAFSGKDGMPLNLSSRVLQRLRKLSEQYLPICSINGGRGLLEHPLTSPLAEERAAALARARRLIDITAALGVDTLLIVPGVIDAETSYDETYDFCVRTLQELAAHAADQRVHLAVENVWNKFLMSPREMRSFLDDISSPWVQAYFDVANTLLWGYPQHWIKALGSRIRRVHVKDCHLNVGNINGFTQPLQGDVDWPVVMQALRDVAYSGFLTAEVSTYRFCGVRAVYDASAALDAILGLGVD